MLQVVRARLKAQRDEGGPQEPRVKAYREPRPCLLVPLPAGSGPGPSGCSPSTQGAPTSSLPPFP